MNFDTAMEIVQPILADPKNRSRQYNYPCSFGFIGENNHLAFHNQACHASLTSIQDKFYYSTVTMDNRKEDFEAIYKFTEWALSDESPWRNLMKGRDRAIVLSDGAVVGYLLSVDKKVDDLKLLKNLSIALRLPQEFQLYFESWKKFVALGVEPSDAFFLSYHYTSSGEFAQEGNLFDRGHNVIDSSVQFDLGRFNNGTPHTEGYGINARFKSAVRNRNLSLATEMRPYAKSAVGRWHKTKSALPFEKIAEHFPAYKQRHLENIITDKVGAAY